MKKFLVVFSFMCVALNGVGQFGAKVPLSNFSRVVETIHSFDLDGDGLNDLVFSCGSGNHIVWSPNEGNEIYKNIYTIVKHDSPSLDHMDCADMDNDGDVDFIYVSWGASKLYYVENLGGQLFADPVEIGSFWSPIHVDIQDVDNNGFNDVLLVDDDNDDVWCLFNINGTSYNTVMIESSLTGASDVLSADMDGDLDLDIVAIGNYNLVWYENIGGGAFSTAQAIDNYFYCFGQISIADIDADGDNDIVSSIGNSYSHIYYYENNGNGIFNSALSINDSVTEPKMIKTGDFDADGDVDVVVATSTNEAILYFEYLGNGNFASKQVLLQVPGPNNNAKVFVDDLDLDGDLDILTNMESRQGKIWFNNDGNGNFSYHYNISVSEAKYPKKSVWFDSDNDGDLDVASVSLKDNKVAFYKNSGNGNFKDQIDVDTTLYWPQEIGVGDINLDGLCDLVVRGDSALVWYENFGNDTFSYAKIVSTVPSNGATYSPYTVKIEDIDNDGDLDIFERGTTTSGEIIWYENVGNGNFLNQQTIANTNSPNNYEKFMLEDIDGDSDLDLVFRIGTEYRIKLNNGFGVFGIDQFLTTTTSFPVNKIKFFDVDNDGLKDIVGGGNAFYYMKNLNFGNFHSPQLIYDISPGYFDNIDVENDGDQDIVFYSSSSSLDYILNDGAGNFSNMQTINNWLQYAKTVYAGDMDNDGDEELLATASFQDNVCFFENLSFFKSHVNGYVFYDENEDGVKNLSDFGIPNISINSLQQSYVGSTNDSGIFSFDISDTVGVYEILSNDLGPNWSLTTDSLSYTIQIDSSITTYNNLIFGYHPNVLIDSIAVDLVGSNAYCGNSKNVWISLKNVGTTISTGYVHLELDTSLIFVDSDFSPDSIINNNIYWSYDSLSYFSQWLNTLQLESSTYSNQGDTIHSNVTAYVVDSIGNVSFVKQDSLAFVLTCDSISNKKEVEPTGVDSPGYIPLSTQKLKYTIFFQNIYSDTIHNISISDKLDSDLDWGSIANVISSHNSTYSMHQNGVLNIEFDNIDLADSTSNSGFVSFEINIKPGTASGTKIINSADITYDLSLMKNTNNTYNTLYDCDSVISNVLYPLQMCLFDTLESNILDSTTNSSFTWEITGVDTLFGSQLSWYCDTVGLFNLELKVINPLCNANFNSQIEVVALDSITDLGIDHICQGQSAVIFSLITDTSGVYFDTLQGINGCDSILKKELVVHAPDYNTLPLQKICLGDSIMIFGDYVTINGVYYDTIQSIYGCDSILIQELHLNPLPIIDLSAISQDTLCTYSGIFNMLPSPTGGTFYGNGTNGYQFYPDVAGEGVHTITYEYVNMYGCSAKDSIQLIVSDCLGIESDEFPDLTIYPNPFTDYTTINFGRELNGGYDLKVYDAQGKVVLAKNQLTGNHLKIHKEKLQKGVYFLSLISRNSEEEVFQAKLIVQ